MRVLTMDVDSLEAIVDEQVRQRAHELREQWAGDQAIRLANVLQGGSPNGK